MTRYLIVLSLLTAAVIAVRAIFKKHLSARLVYALWLVVLIKMCLPLSVFELELDLPEGMSFLSSEQGNEQASKPDINMPDTPNTDTPDVTLPNQGGTLVDPNGPTEPQNPEINTDPDVGGKVPSVPEGSDTPAEPDTPELPTPSLPQIPQEPQAPSTPQTPPQSEIVNKPAPQIKSEKLSTGAIIGIVWGVGAVALASWFGITAFTYFSKVKKGRTFVQAMGNHSIYLSTNADTPCLIGRDIYLTPSANTDVRRDLAIQHELTHFRHGDHIWSVVCILALCVFWWNPLIWAAAILSRQDAELACDEAVVEKLTEDKRIPYARLIVDMIPKKKLYAVGLGGGSLKKRIIALTTKHKRHLITAVCVVLIAAFITGCAMVSVSDKPADDLNVPAEPNTPDLPTPDVGPNGYQTPDEPPVNPDGPNSPIEPDDPNAPAEPNTPDLPTPSLPQIDDTQPPIDDNTVINVGEYSITYGKLREDIEKIENWFRLSAFAGLPAGEFSFADPSELGECGLLMAYFALAQDHDLQKNTDGTYKLDEKSIKAVLDRHFKNYKFKLTENADAVKKITDKTYNEYAHSYDIKLYGVTVSGNHLSFTAEFEPYACIKKTYTLEFYNRGYRFVSVTDDLTLSAFTDEEKDRYIGLLKGYDYYWTIGDSEENGTLRGYLSSKGLKYSPHEMMFALVDLSNDQKPEIMVTLPDWKNNGALIFKASPDTVNAVAYEISYADWSDVRVNSMASSQNGNLPARVSADIRNGILKINKVTAIEYDLQTTTHRYMLGLQIVTADEYKAEEAFYNKAPRVAFYALTEENIIKAINGVDPKPETVTASTTGVNLFAHYGRLYNQWAEQTSAQFAPDFDAEKLGREAAPEGEVYYFYHRIAFEDEYMIFTSQSASSGKVIIPCINKNGFTRNLELTIPNEYPYTAINPVLYVSGGGSGEFGVILQLINGETVTYLRYDNFTKGWNNKNWDKLECVGLWNLPENHLETVYGQAIKEMSAKRLAEYTPDDFESVIASAENKNIMVARADGTVWGGNAGTEFTFKALCKLIPKQLRPSYDIMYAWGEDGTFYRSDGYVITDVVEVKNWNTVTKSDGSVWTWKSQSGGYSAPTLVQQSDKTASAPVISELDQDGNYWKNGKLILKNVKATADLLLLTENGVVWRGNGGGLLPALDNIREIIYMPTLVHGIAITNDNELWVFPSHFESEREGYPIKIHDNVKTVYKHQLSDFVVIDNDDNMWYLPVTYIKETESYTYPAEMVATDVKWVVSSYLHQVFDGSIHSANYYIDSQNRLWKVDFETKQKTLISTDVLTARVIGNNNEAESVIYLRADGILWQDDKMLLTDVRMPEVSKDEPAPPEKVYTRPTPKTDSDLAVDNLSLKRELLSLVSEGKLTSGTHTVEVMGLSETVILTVKDKKIVSVSAKGQDVELTKQPDLTDTDRYSANDSVMIFFEYDNMLIFQNMRSAPEGLYYRGDYLILYEGGSKELLSDESIAGHSVHLFIRSFQDRGLFYRKRPNKVLRYDPLVFSINDEQMEEGCIYLEGGELKEQVVKREDYSIGAETTYNRRYKHIYPTMDDWFAACKQAYDEALKAESIPAS